MPIRILFALCAFALTVSAQEYRGTILGQVTDPQAASVPAVKVKATNRDTGLVTETTTNAEGLYRLPLLLPGTYQVSVEHTGFKKMTRDNVPVSVNATVTVDLVLEIGSSAEAVTITAEAPLLNTTNAELGQVIDRSFINVINVSLSRNANNLALLSPGVTGSTGTYTSNAQTNVSITGGGSQRGGNEYLIDGIPNTVPASGGLVVFVPSLDQVDEVKVQTTLFDAQFGRSNGGAISISTKGGGNELHGAGYWFKRWRALNANSWNNNRLGLPRPEVKYDQYGYMFSGPVYLPRLYDGRNRTFFSTSLERDSEPRELTRQGRVPTALERQGDFSQTTNLRGGAFAVYDPATTLITGNTATRQPFAGNRIPAARQSATGKAILNALPDPKNSAVNQLGQFNWNASGTYTVAQRSLSTRIDHVISQRQRLFGRISRMVRTQEADMLFPNVQAFSPQGATDLGLNLRHFHAFGLDDTITISPALIASVRYGFSRRYSNVSNGGVGTDTAFLSLPSQIIANQTVAGVPIFNLGEGIPTIGATFSRSANDQHSLLASVIKIAGSHSLKFGADYRVVRINDANPGNAAAGSFNFTALFTQQNPFIQGSADTSGTSMASALLNVPTSGSFGYNSALSLQNHYLGLFIQDDWKISRKLTINLGLRHELETPYTERYNRVAYGFDENARLPVSVPGLDLRGGIRFAGVDGNPRRQGQLDKNNFGPRAGFAYSLTSNTVIRGGYGLFFAPQINNSTFLGQVGTFNAITPYVGTIDNATPFTTLANPFPGGLRSPLGSSVGLMAQVGDNLTIFDDRRVNPYNQQWQLSVQRQFRHQIVLDMAYVGSHNLKLFETFNLNETPDRFLPLGTAANTRVTNPFLGAFPTNSTLGQGTTVTQNRLWPRYPQFTTLNMQGVNTGRGLYHAFQLNANKRFSGGFSALFVYTFSRLMDNNTTSIINPRSYRSVSEFDQKHDMRAAFTWKVPVNFTGSSLAGKFGRQALGGWSLSGVVSYLSGNPLTITHANGRPVRIANPRLEGPVGERLGDRREGNRVVNPYFNTAAFQPNATQFVVPPEPPFFDELRAPNTKGLNAFLSKTFPIQERFKLEVRMEATGITNSPNFNAPGTNLSQLATFGVINGAGGSRQMQGALRLTF